MRNDCSAQLTDAISLRNDFDLLLTRHAARPSVRFHISLAGSVGSLLKMSRPIQSRKNHTRKGGRPAPSWLPAEKTSGKAVSTNHFGPQLPFQRWFKFKEAFSPQFIVDCASSLGKSPATCLDPFGGSGTTALTAQFLGIRPTTVEVNPFLADLIEAKLSRYNSETLRADYLEVLSVGKELESASLSSLLVDAPATFIEPGVANRWIYPSSVALRILALREAIARVTTRQNRLLLKVVLGSILVSLSNVVINGKGRRYRGNWHSRQRSAADVETSFRQAFFNAFSDVCLHGERDYSEFTLIRGDSRIVIDQSESVDFAVLSPPYPNSFDYTDIYNLELWILGYLNSRPDNVRLREETLRSHVQIYREFSEDTLGSNALRRSYRALCRQREDLWNPHIPEMVCAYFSDMKVIITKLKARLNKGGKVFLAVGNSRYAGVTVETETILKDIALANGFRQARSSPIRSMRASAQQGGRHELTESLITLC